MRISTLNLNNPQRTQQNSHLNSFSPSFKHVMRPGTIRASLWDSFIANATKKQMKIITDGIVKNSSNNGDKGSLNWLKREYWQYRAYAYGFFAKLKGGKTLGNTQELL